MQQNPMSSSLPMKKRKTRLELPPTNGDAMNGSSRPSEAQDCSSGGGGGGYIVAKTFGETYESHATTRNAFSNKVHSTPESNSCVVSNEITPRNNVYETPQRMATKPVQSPTQQSTKNHMGMPSSKPLLKTPDASPKKRSTRKEKKCNDDFVIDKQGNDRKRAAQSQEAEEASPKKKRASKGLKYTDDEVGRLLEAAGSVQPKCDEEWAIVKQRFEASAPPGASVRSIASLKCKLSTVSLKLVMKALAKKPPGANPLDIDALGMTSKKRDAGNLENGKDPTRSDDDSVSVILRMITNTSSFDNTGEIPEDDNMVGMKGEEGTFPNTNLFADLDAEISLGNEKTVTDKNPNRDAIVQEAEKLSDSMIKFFEKFGTSDGMVIQKETVDLILSRVQKIESDVAEMKGAIMSVHANTSAILSMLQYRNGGYCY
jgi:hypothetical protein